MSYDHRTYYYAELAAISQDKQQMPARDRFLTLAGINATRAGWLKVAEECRRLILQHNPQHLIGRFRTFPEALRDTDFQPFAAQLERQCPIEKAEHLLAGLGVCLELPTVPDGKTLGDIVLQHLMER